MHLYRHSEIPTQRPYAFDVDEDGWLWEGERSDRLYRHNVYTAECSIVPPPIVRGVGACDVKCFGGMLVVAVQNGGEYVVYDPASDGCWTRPIPGDDPHIWFMAKLDDGRLVLFERHHSRLLILEEPLGEARVVTCPYDSHIAGGRCRSDGLLYMNATEPARIIRFDPLRNEFLDEIHAPFPFASMTGSVERDGVLYVADSVMGRLLPLEMASGRWLDPIPVPGHGTDFGFIGGAVEHEGKGIYCLGTYRYVSRLVQETGGLEAHDPVTDEIVSWETAAIGVDGRPQRFLGRQLIFDPADGTFIYLDAPRQPNGETVLCYSWSQGERLYITGHIVPFDASGEPSGGPGDWVILQSHAAGGSAGRKQDVQAPT